MSGVLLSCSFVLAVFSFDLCTLDAHEKQVLEENTEQML